jgi:CheY-like chemotaxis protein
MHIDTAESGDEAISLYKERHYDVIFLDHMMPKKDGIETLTEMHGIPDSPNGDTPIICLTANAISGMREMYIKAGFDDYMTKPINPESLENLLLEYIPKEKIEAPDEVNDEDNTEIPKFIYNIPELNVNSGISHCGSKHSYMSTLKLYIDAAAKNAEELEKLWNEEDLKNLTIRVHSLKSTSRMIGALALGDHAAALEKAGDMKDTEKLAKELPDLIEEYRKLASALKSLNEKDEDSSKEDTRPLITDESLKEAYTTLSEFCASYDFDSVAQVIKKLGTYRMPESEAERYDKLVKAVDNYDYDLIPGILDGGKQ